jgi:hypothetical protein
MLIYMPRQVLAITEIIRAGVTQPAAVYADITNAHEILGNDGRTFVELANVSNAGSVDATFDVSAVYDGDLTIVDIIVALAPGGTKYVGPFKRGVFNQGLSESVYFSIASTGVSIRGYRLES